MKHLIAREERNKRRKCFRGRVLEANLKEYTKTA